MKEENALQPTKEDLSHLFKIEEGLKKYIYHDHLSLSREGLWETLLNVTFDRFFSIESLPLKEFIDDLERRLIIRTIFRVNGNRKEAAKLLGIKYTTLHEKLRKHNIRFRNMAY
jgi:DNA-binding NtrC family response regulator